MTDELDVGALHRSAELALSNSQYRQKYERADFLTLNRFQKVLLDTVSHNRFVIGRAGGQIGKSTAAMAYVNACIKAGRHPDREPPKLDRPYKFVVWVLSESGQTTILGPQTRLIGAYPEGVGTGLLSLRNIKKCTGAHGVPGLVSEAMCETDAGEPCIVRFRQYQQGKQALTSEGVDLIVCDELPPDKQIWAELMQRVAATNGTILVVATPGRQQNDILHWFKEPGPSKAVVAGTVDDAEHMSANQKAELAAHYRSISEAEYRSRYLGEEYVGGGRVFSFKPQDCIYTLPEGMTFGNDTRWLLGIDLGHGTGEGGHPTAALGAAYQPDLDRVAIVREYRKNQVLPGDVWSAVKNWQVHGRSIGGAPVAWGAAERQSAGFSGKSYRDLYADAGFAMLPDHAKHRDNSVSVETSVADIQQRIRDGRLVFMADIHMVVRELLDLERDEDGNLLAIRDDLFAALRYLLMSLKSARCDVDFRETSRPRSSGGSSGIATGTYDNPLDW